MRDHPGSGAARRAVGVVVLDAEAMIDVAVGQDRGVERVAVPSAQGVVHLLGEEEAAGVDEHEAVVGSNAAHVREHGHERRAGTDLCQVAPLHDRVMVSDVRSPVHNWSASSSKSVVTAAPSCAAPIVASKASTHPSVLAHKIRTCFNFVMPAPVPLRAGPTPTALARNQAARRRRVLDATLVLAAGGGFDAVQMRDVATEANVALGTVYRYFSSKERLLLEANVEQVEELDLRACGNGHRRRDRGRIVLSRCCDGPRARCNVIPR